MPRTLLTTLVLLLTSLTARAADGPKVVCFGDSITKAGYPKVLGEILKADVVNAGAGGHTTAMGLKRMQKDVLDAKPTVVVVFFGTNDCRLAEPEVAVPVAQYEKNLTTIADACAKAGAKVVICTMPPINPEPYFKRHKKEPFDKVGGLEKVCEEYRAAARRVAEANKLPLVDLGAQLAKTPEWMAPDGVHPTPAGTKLIAQHIAEAVKPLIGK
ncbi:MAG TPA: GDSL-type esterase/lipase family protein [Tepidisphaeraceae bacterium]|nr:GDSL-type esterase/lipase family protein [Tepidisphaeraceae bacterium]